ncbi:MAG TPA: flavin reductase [Bacteroidales bacterium]|nr:flavin reductase [Bacteroidales bacterium]
MTRKIIILAVIILTATTLKAQNNMTNTFEKTTWESLNDNAIRMIGKDWMLIGAGTKEQGFNMMTASWGGMGWLWEKPVSFIFVRPQRYTYQFTERENYYTVCFFSEEHREALKICGSKSGRDCDKVKESGLTPIFTPSGCVAFEEAVIILECKKLYAGNIEESNFVDTEVVKSKYPNKDFHKMYIGEIVNVWRKK